MGELAQSAGWPGVYLDVRWEVCVGREFVETVIDLLDMLYVELRRTYWWNAPFL